MLIDYFTLALSNLKQRGLRSLLTMLGIFIGIAAVVSLITLGQGLQEAITGQFTVLDSDKLLIQSAGTGFGPPGSTAVRKLTEDDLELIQGVGGVKETVVRLIQVVSFEFNKVQKFKTITSIPLDEVETEIVRDFLNAEIEEGKFIEDGDQGKIVVGNSIIDDFYVR